MKVGIVGAGGIGQVHVRAWSKVPGIEILIFDRKLERSESIRDRFSAKVAPSFEEIIERSDAVDICLPTDLHCDSVIEALKHKKPVLCEKPLARNLAEAQKMLDAAQEFNCILMPAQVVRFFPEYKKAHDLVKKGIIGDAAVIRLSRGGRMPSGTDGWFRDHLRSGGVLLDLAIHDFDWIRWTFGEIEHVYSQSVGSKTQNGIDYGLTLLKLKCGAIAHVESSWLEPDGFRCRFEIAGSLGLIEHDSRDSASLIIKVSNSTSFESNFSEQDDPFVREMTVFKDAVENKIEPPITAEDGYHSLSLSLAAIESAKTGARIIPEHPTKTVSVW